jgi:hypothetical protein
MQQMAGGTWDKLEQVFEDRVARALSKLGVYTQNDVQQLVERVDALSEAVNRLIATTPGQAPLATRTRGKRSSASKALKAPAKKRAGKRAAAAGKSVAGKTGASRKRRAAPAGDTSSSSA